MNRVNDHTLLDDMLRHQVLPLPMVKQAAREILDLIREGLIRDGAVSVSNFGSFRLKPVASRIGINPQTRERINIAAHQRVIFTPCNALRELIEPVAEAVLAQTRIVMGVAVVENAHDETMVVEVLPRDRILPGEPALLDLARAHMPALPVEQLDVLLVDQMGKDISGVGMDTNVIGRMMIAGVSINNLIGC